jgi:DNA polymerase elongation subunit (family B)
LAYALKIVVNTVYGLTSAKFDNPFRDIRNKDNIVAKRGALFMIDLKHSIQEKGYTVAHIKTDSIKIPTADDEIVQFITDYGTLMGYDFEHEGVYEKFCLVNDAVYRCS